MINTQLDIRAKQYGSAAEILEAARRRRERLFGSRQVVANENSVQIEAPKPQKPVPMWSVVQIEFDHHVLASAVYIRLSSGDTMRNHIKRRASELGFTYNEIVGKSRTRKVVAARSQIIYECSRKFKKSLPEIGRAFGKDHTTILNNIRIASAKHDPDGEEARKLKRRYAVSKAASEKLKAVRRKNAFEGKYKPNAAQIEVLRHIADGNNVAQVAKILGLSKSTIRTRFRRVSEATGITGHAAVTALAIRKGWVK